MLQYNVKFFHIIKLLNTEMVKQIKYNLKRHD